MAVLLPSNKALYSRLFAGDSAVERRREGYVELENKARQLLLDEKPPKDMPDAVCDLLLSVQPTFENYVSWAVFANLKNDDLLVRYTIWDRLFDYRRFTNPMDGLKYGWHTIPTMTIRIVGTLPPDLRTLLEVSRSIHKEPNNNRGIVVDGIRFLLKIRGNFEDRLLSWNALGNYQDELAIWAEKMLRALEQVFL
jgi:hypothetical protein